MRAADCKILAESPEGVFRQAKYPGCEIAAGILFLVLLFMDRQTVSEIFLLQLDHLAA